jgi:hypothetical protein
MFAGLWKYLAGALAVLAVAAILAAVLFHERAAAGRARADAAEGRASALEAQLREARAAAKRDDISTDATSVARTSAADRNTEHNARAERVEAIAHESRPPVSVVCPAPDPRLMRELAEGRKRVSATEDRLRGIGRPAGQVAH